MCGRFVCSPSASSNAHLAVLEQAVQLVRSLAPSSCAACDALQCVGVSATVRTGVAGDSNQRGPGGGCHSLKGSHHQPSCGLSKHHTRRSIGASTKQSWSCPEA